MFVSVCAVVYDVSFDSGARGLHGQAYVKDQPVPKKSETIPQKNC